MSKSNSIKAILCVIICLLSAGCQRKDTDFSALFTPEVTPFTANDIGKPVATATKLEVFIENPIELITKNGTHFSSLSIDGLKDKNTQNKINEALQILFKEMEDFALRKKLPPYRGVYKYVEKSPVSDSLYYHVYTTFNANNILSVLGHAHMSQMVDGKLTYFTHMKPLTIDLNTGEAIELSQLFIDNSSGLSRVNEILQQDFAGAEDDKDDLFFTGYRPYQLIKPFEGIDASWPFYLSQHDIVICFDYRATDFDMAEGAFTMMVPFKSFKDILAFQERFMLGAPLYESKTSHMTFYQEHIPNSPSTPISETINGISWFNDTSFTTENEKINASTNQLLAEKLMWINQQLDEQKDFNSVSLVSTAFTIGPYTTFHLYSTLYGENFVKNREDAYVFDASGTLLTIKDLFKPKFNYADFLIPFLKAQQLNSEYKDLILPINVIDKVNFKLESTGLYFFYYDEITMDFPLGFYLDYAEIGLENLNLFSKHLQNQ